MADARQIATHCEAVKVAYVQTEKGYKVTFAIHPSEMPPELALAPIGTRVVLAVAEIATDGAGDAEAPPAPPESVPLPVKNGDASDRAKAAYASKDDMAKAVTRAARLCKDPAFQDWMESRAPDSWMGPNREADTASALKHCLGFIKSRSEIASNERAYEAFLGVEAAYKYRDQIR